MRAGLVLLGALLGLALPAAAESGPAGQDPNYLLPPAEIERRLASEPFEVVGFADNRFEGDRTQRTALRFRDGIILPAKWAGAAAGGEALNNQPRYEVAAYRLQKLFLDPVDWVVPPTVLRVLPVRVYRLLDADRTATFEGTRSVLVVLQYWLDGVEPLVRPDAGRAGERAYDRALAHLNLLTYLIRHADSNTGNVLVSTAGAPRMWAVDNGVAFESPEGPLGTFWKELHVARLPAGAVDRLRGLDRAALDRALGTIAQLRIGDDRRLELVEPGPRRRTHLAIDAAGGDIQVGLTDRELDGLWSRLQDLLRRVDAGEITTF